MVAARHPPLCTRAARARFGGPCRNVEGLRQTPVEFRERYNRHWIVERLGYLTPAQARQQLLAQGVAAASVSLHALQSSRKTSLPILLLETKVTR